MGFDHRDTKSTEIFYTRFRISAGNAKYSSSRDSDLAGGQASGSIGTVLIMLRQQRKRSGWPCLLGWAVFSPWRCRFDDPVNGLDSDGDGLTNYAERTQHHTNPAVSDTDDDGLTDSEELFTYFTNPLLQKTNPQQLYTDYYMVSLTDTDGDQIPDLIEQWYFSQGFTMNKDDPLDGKGDLDGDGYSNTQGYLNGWSLTMSFNNNFDGDGDRILDVLEDVWAAQYPGSLNKADPNDAVLDFDNDGVMNFEEIALGLNPGSPQSRSGPLTDVQVLALTETRTTRVLPQDCDGDGMSDVWEHRYFLNLRDASDAGAASGLLAAPPTLLSWEEFVSAWDPTGVSTPTEQNYLEYTDQHALTVAGQARSDPDFDLLSNLREFQLGSHPRIADTDGDGYDDAAELLAGSNATLVNSTPLNPTGGTNTTGGGGGGTTTGNNHTTPAAPPVIALAGRFNVVSFGVQSATSSLETKYGVDENLKQQLLMQGWEDASGDPDVSSTIVTNEWTGLPELDDEDQPQTATWKVKRTYENPAQYDYKAAGTQRSEPEEILSNEEITQMVEEGGEAPAIGGYLALAPAEPDKSASTGGGELGASRGSRTEGQATFKTGSWREFWLRASAAVPAAVSRSYIIRKTSTNGGTPQFTSVTLTIPKGGKHSTQGGTSGTIKLHPAEGESMSLLPIDLKVTDFATKSDTVPYVATTNATPPKNSELCLKADKTNEKAKIEIELPSITDATMLSKMKWKVIKKPADTMVSEGVFGGATAPSAELTLGSGSSVEDEILFEVQVGADGTSFTPAAKMNVRVVRDRLNWWFEPFSSDFGWRTAKPEPRADTGDYPAHKANAYKRESLQSVYEFFKSSTAIGPSTPKANWVKPSITCFGQFHDAIKTANGNNPLVDLTSLARINMTAVTELPSFDLKYGSLRSAQGRQTTYPTDDNPTLRAAQFPERVQWATAASNAIGSPNLPRGRLLAIWQKEGSLRLNTQSSTTTNFDANLAASELGASAPTSSDNAKVCYIYNATYQCLGSDFLIQTYRIGGADDNIPDLRDYAAAMTHIRTKADQIGGAGSGDKLFNALTGTAVGSGYTVSINAPAFYEELLRLVGLYYLAGWQAEGPDVSYMVYNMGTTSFTNLKNTLGNAAYPERARLGLTDWAIHYEIRPTEYTQPRDHAQKFYAYRVAFEAKYP